MCLFRIIYKKTEKFDILFDMCFVHFLKYCWRLHENTLTIWLTGVLKHSLLLLLSDTSLWHYRNCATHNRPSKLVRWHQMLDKMHTGTSSVLGSSLYIYNGLFFTFLTNFLWNCLNNCTSLAYYNLLCIAYIFYAFVSLVRSVSTLLGVQNITV